MAARSGEVAHPLEAHPARTDSSVSDAGVVRLEGTLGHAASLRDVALDLQGEWRNAPLGEASRLLTARDAGLRGTMTLSAAVKGTVGRGDMRTQLRLESLRRADFVPEHELSIDVTCVGTELNAFHGFEMCAAPGRSRNDGVVSLQGSLADVRRPGVATLDVATQKLPVATVLDWLHVASSRVPADVSGQGSFAGQAAYGKAGAARGPLVGRIERQGPEPEER